MTFIHWLVLGFLAYVSGFGIRHFHYKNSTITKEKAIQFTLICFVIAVAIFATINVAWLKKAFDIAFIGVSSLVATGIFYYGLTADTSNNMKLPD